MLDIRHIVGAVLLFVKGLVEIIEGCRDFYELEKRVQELSRAVCNRLVTWALEEIDTRLMKERDRKKWEVIGFRKKTIISASGELNIKRRLYKNRETGEAKYLLDEAVGWPERAKVTPYLRELAVKLSVELPFRRAAEVLNYLVPDLSAMTIWQVTQEAGEAAQQEGEEKRSAIFEDGEIPEGKEVVEELHFEGDGIVVNLQREKEKRGEVKHIVSYRGKRQISRGRNILQDKQVTSTMEEWRKVWEESYARNGEKIDLEKVGTIYIGGDGAQQVKEGLEYFPRAIYCLDRYHLNRHLIEALHHDEEAYKETCAAISEGNWVKIQAVITEASKKTKGNRKKRLIKLLDYLRKNWEGIVNSEEAKRLGAIEGQNQHNIARRMKRLGAQWTIAGGDRMARLLAARANGELSKYTVRWSVEHKKLKEAVQLETIELKTESSSEGKIAGDIGEWLQASVPALRGPFAGRPWIKHVLRELTRPEFAALVC